MRDRWPANRLSIKRAFLIPLLAVAVHGQYRSPSASHNSNAAHPTANDPATIALGRKLFFDTRLSADEKLSCSSCHDPAHAYSDARPLSVGVFGRQGKRHTPTLLGRRWGTSQFWDGRAATLEEQVLQPIAAPDELGMSVEGVLERLNRDRAYRNLDRASLAEALAGYVRTLQSEDSPLDRFLSGRAALDDDRGRDISADSTHRGPSQYPGPNQSSASNQYRGPNQTREGAKVREDAKKRGLTPLEFEGFRLFQDKARCYLCHSGRQFTDEKFHNTGVAWRDDVLQDEGRATIDGKPYHKGAFKTPTLRQAGQRRPFMHDGSLATLEDVIEFYDRGGNPNPYLDENIVPLHLSKAEKKALLAFLKNGLSGTLVEGEDRK